MPRVEPRVVAVGHADPHVQVGRQQSGRGRAPEVPVPLSHPRNATPSGDPPGPVLSRAGAVIPSAACRGRALVGADPVPGVLRQGLGAGLSPEGQGEVTPVVSTRRASRPGGRLRVTGLRRRPDDASSAVPRARVSGPADVGQCPRSRDIELYGVSPDLRADQRDATAAADTELGVCGGEQMGPRAPPADSTDVPRRPEHGLDVVERRAAVQRTGGCCTAEPGQGAWSGHLAECRAAAVASTESPAARGRRHAPVQERERRRASDSFKPSRAARP